METYGYARISNPTQNIERQIRNIKAEYPEALIFQEAYTGREMIGRKEFERLLHKVKCGDTIIFDSVSRMSRNAEDGVKLYFELYEKGITLVFLKEPYINTEIYKQAIQKNISETGNEIADMYIETTNRVLKLLAKKQIEAAFQQSEKEVSDLRHRTREGMETARKNGKQIGLASGTKLKIQKAKYAKIVIQKYSKSFNGSMTDKEVMTMLAGMTYQHIAYKKNGEVGRVEERSLRLNKDTYYKYKGELKEKLS